MWSSSFASLTGLLGLVIVLPLVLAGERSAQLPAHVSTDRPSDELIGDAPGLRESTTSPLTPREADPPRAGPVRVARWKNDKPAAVTFTFDDGIEDQVTIAAPMLESFGYRGTFFICPGRTLETADDAATQPASTQPASIHTASLQSATAQSAIAPSAIAQSAAAQSAIAPSGGILRYGTWTQWQSLASRGHEIGSHTWDHLALDKVTTPDRLELEIIHSREVIEQKLDRPCVSFAYPFNIETDDARKLINATYAFEAGGKRRWYGGHHFKAGTANHEIDMAIAEQGWQVAMIHSIETGYGTFASRDVLRNHLEYVYSKNDQLWVDTFSNIGRYHREIRMARLKLLSNDQHSARFVVQCSSLNPQVFGEPLTLVINAPGASTPIAVRQGSDDPIKVTIRGNDLLLDVVPEKSPVTVSWK